MTSDDSDWDQLIEGVRAGRPESLHTFFSRYGPALERLAARAIEPGLRRRFGPETIAQSVCRTFLRRAAGNEFELADGDSLWRLLCAIALTKVREKARFHLRQKRGVNREVPLRSAAALAFNSGPSAEDEVLFADQFEHILETLEDEQRQILELRLEGLTQEEIATRMACSERTVRRLLRRLEDRLLRAFDA